MFESSFFYFFILMNALFKYLLSAYVRKYLKTCVSPIIIAKINYSLLLYIHLS